jgi:hypothetical protein
VAPAVVARLVEDLGLDKLDQPSEMERQPRPKRTTAVLPCIERLEEGVPQGARNVAAFTLALDSKERGLSMEDTLAVLQVWNELNKPPLDEGELRRTVESAYRGNYQSYPCGNEIVRKYCDEEKCEMEVEHTETDPVFSRDGHALICELDGLLYRIVAPQKERAGPSAVVELRHKKELLHLDKVSLWSSQSRTKFANRIESHDKALIEQHLVRIYEELGRFFEVEAKRTDEKEVRPEPEMSEEEREEAMGLLKDPKLIDRIVADISTLGYVGEEMNKLVIYLVATSRKLGRREESPDQPMALLVKGESASGKTAMVDTVLKLMPPEDVFQVTSFSEKALLYLPRDYLQHKIVVVTERLGAEGADYYLRSLISERRISHAVTTGSPEIGFQTVVVELEGPIAYIETTTQAQINLENETRAFELHTDRSETQTRAIHAHQRRRRTKEGLRCTEKNEGIRRLHHNAQRLLDHVEVVIPFAETIEFPASKRDLRLRRDHNRFLTLITISAFLFQHQRHRYKEGDIWFVEATLEDYRVALKIIQKILPDSLSEVSRRGWEALVGLYHALENSSGELEGFTFTINNLSDWINLSQTATRDRVKELMELEFVLLKNKGEGGKPSRYCLNPDYPQLPPRHLRGLLTAEQLQEKLRAKETELDEG